MRLYRVTKTQATVIARWGEADGTDARGNPLRVGWVDGRRIRVVIALDNPDFVITLYERRT
jgi:hypothetical protein